MEDKTKIGKSKIQGKGLLANMDLRGGRNIGVSHEDNWPNKAIGENYNHSDTPNARNVDIGNKKYVVPIGDIKNGEEITVDYKTMPEMEQPGNFIFDKNGQWNHPGKKTAVPTQTGKITTKGVEQTLHGVDNLGNEQIMYPNNEYQFDGNLVFETPMARNGGGIMAKMQRGGGTREPIYLTDPNDPRLQGYQDSLTLSNFTKAQEKVERGYPSMIFSPWQYADAEKDPRHHDLQVMADDAVSNNPRIDWHLGMARPPGYEYKVQGDEEWFDKEMPFQRKVQLYNDEGDFVGFESGKLKKGDNVRFSRAFNVWDKLKNNPRTEKVNKPNSPDISHKTIKPTDWYLGRGSNDVYTPPVQPYMYREEVEEVEDITDIASAVITPPEPKVTTDPNLSVDVRMRHMNMDASYANRKRIAAEAGIENYKGTLEQNPLLNQYIVDNYNDQGIKNEPVVVEPTETVQPVMEEEVIEEVKAPVDSNDIPVSLDMSKPKPEPKTNESGTVKPPQSNKKWKQIPSTGTWYQEETPVSPEKLESRKIGFSI